MFVAKNWKDYEVIDCSKGEKLERWGKYILCRPDPQVIWQSEKKNPFWKKLNGHYHRSKAGGGDWEFFSLPKQWQISYPLGENGEDSLNFHLKPFAFKHTGIFPEQAVNWEWFHHLIKKEKERREKSGDKTPIKVLNLFAYTGGATLAAAKAGAELTHVDASKGMVSWAKENAEGSGLADSPIRYLVDDCVKFVEREIRRGNLYDGIIMDPPSYGRGPKGEIWKIEDSIYPFLKLSEKVLKKDALFFLLNSYTTGLQAGVMQYMLEELIGKGRRGKVSSDEIGLPVSENGLVLPCGCAARWEKAES
jgi:SAM-dependent methyltransferase family protein